MVHYASEPGVKHGLAVPQNAAVRLGHAYWNSGAALITSAAFLFSCTSLAVKLIGDEVPTFQVVLVPGLLCFLATSLVVNLYGLSVRNKSWRVTGLTLLRGLLGATSITCFYLAIQLLPLQDAVTLFFCSPVVAALLELAVTGESHGWAGAAATAFTVAGVVLVAQPECVFSHSHDHHMPGGSGTSAAGMALATIAAVANAAAFVVVRLIKHTQSTAVLTWWYHLVVVAVSAVPLTLRYPAPAVVPSSRGCGLLAVVGLTQFLGQLLLNRGFQLESATRGSAINVLQVLFSFLWDVTVLGDKPGLVSVGGSSLVAAGVLCVALTGTPPHAEGRLPHHRTHRHHPHADDDLGDVAATEPLVPHDSTDPCAPAPGAAEAEGEAAVVVDVDTDSRADSWVRARRGRDPGGPRGESGGDAGSSGGSGGGGGGSGSDGDSDAPLRQPLLVQVAGRLSLPTAT